VGLCSLLISPSPSFFSPLDDINNFVELIHYELAITGLLYMTTIVLAMFCNSFFGRHFTQFETQLSISPVTAFASGFVISLLFQFLFSFLPLLFSSFLASLLVSSPHLTFSPSQLHLSNPIEKRKGYLAHIWKVFDTEEYYHARKGFLRQNKLLKSEFDFAEYLKAGMNNVIIHILPLDWAGKTVNLNFNFSPLSLR
jgi:hypothetical protein